MVFCKHLEAFCYNNIQLYLLMVCLIHYLSLLIRVPYIIACKCRLICGVACSDACSGQNHHHRNYDISLLCRVSCSGMQLGHYIDSTLLFVLI